MNWKGHLFMGTVFGGALFFFNIIALNITNVALAIPIIFLYSLLPDSDISSSKIFRILLLLSFIVIAAGYYFRNKWMVFVPVGFFLLMFLANHRGFTHSIIFAAVVSLPLIYLGFGFAILGFTAYMSHLIADGEIKLL